MPCGPGGDTGCRAVTPPCADDVIRGIGCPDADSGSPIAVVDTGGPRRDRGMYGVYVGWSVCVGCRGGGSTPPGRGGIVGGIWLVVLGSCAGEAAAGDMGGVDGAEDAGVILPETTSG